MTAQRYRIDTNVLLRFLRADHPEHSPATRSLFESAANARCTILLDALVVAESVWVLSSYYKAERARIADALSRLIASPGIDCEDRDVLLDALDRYAQKNIDFADCYLAAKAASRGEAVVSFDADFRRFDDVVLLHPGAAR